MSLEDSIWASPTKTPSPAKKAGKNQSNGLETSMWAHGEYETHAADTGKKLVSEKGRKSLPRPRQVKETKEHDMKKANPLALRLGMVDVDSGVSSDSEEISRPSTNDRNAIFDRKPHRVGDKPLTPKNRTKSNKQDLLQAKIGEQKKILGTSRHKQQQENLLSDFLKDDTGFDWNDDLN
ncbi:LAMI_0G00562g1_1 [Lachancea mirantina]|uniref:LAMI_0G00562g1_1 n=1 Tax=Lachancea mirantina TaxID=1230905 RepID=A0A1G4K756_9SACH|nr:LAMI_0G00562g1_1 [Lachancea mirantina]